LRDEAAAGRTKLKQYDEAFQGYSEVEIDQFLNVARALTQDPVAAADWFEDVAKNIKQGMTEQQAQQAATETAAAAGVGAEPAEKPLTQQDFERLLDEREATRATQKAQEDALQGVYAEMKTLGYDPDTGDGMRVMYLAVNSTNGDLAEADKLVKAEKQAIIDAYLEEKRKDARAAGVTPRGASIASGEREIKSLEDAHMAAKMRLSAQQIGR
jgi:hypothetical protein